MVHVLKTDVKTILLTRWNKWHSHHKKCTVFLGFHPTSFCCLGTSSFLLSCETVTWVVMCIQMHYNKLKADIWPVQHKLFTHKNVCWFMFQIVSDIQVGVVHLKIQAIKGSQLHRKISTLTVSVWALVLKGCQPYAAQYIHPCLCLFIN